MKNPTDIEIDDLFERYQKGQFVEAEKLAKSLCQKYPNHPFSWKVLGAIFKQTGKLQDSLAANRKAVELAPSDAAAHNNLGITLHELLMLNEAEKCYRKAIELYPNFAEAHNNLGVTLQELGSFADAEISYKNTIVIKADFIQAHYNLGITLQELGRIEEAKESYQNAIAINANHADAHYNLGNTFKELNSFEEAESSYRKALEINPSFASAYNNLGIVLQEFGKLEDSEICYRSAITHNSEFSEAYSNLGNIMKELLRLDEAEKYHQKAIEINPVNAEAYLNLGSTLKELGRLGDAESSYKKAISINPKYADAHSNLGAIFSEKNELQDAIKHLNIALEYSPKLVNAQINLAENLRKLIPGWHVPMMNEQKRNDAYYFALKSLIKPNTAVFEIGTGSGLLSMMAAKLGAQHVSTCESNLIIAETAKKIIADNGYDQVINLISKKSTNVTLGQDLPKKPGLLVTEIFSNELLGEFVLPSIEDAKRRLLASDAQIIPATGSIMVSLFGGADMQNSLFAQEYRGLRLEKFNSIVSKKVSLFNKFSSLELYADDAEAFRFELASKAYFPSEKKTLKIPVKSSGLCYGIIQWIRLEMTKEIVYENHPSISTETSHWQHMAYLFAEPIQLNQGDIAVISASHNRTSPWFSLESIHGR
jgi:tetratricopeptide (TPR) repeat protein